MAELSAIDNPILNDPYDPPTAHFELGPNGPTGEIIPRRRPSESFIPVPAPKGRKASAQQQLDVDVMGERREKNCLVNDIRAQVELWRARGIPAQAPLSDEEGARPPRRGGSERTGREPLHLAPRQSRRAASLTIQ